MPVFSIGHGTRPVAELLECLREAHVQTLVDVRRFPLSRRNPQFNQAALAEAHPTRRAAAAPPSDDADVRNEKLFLCGEFVA